MTYHLDPDLQRILSAPVPPDAPPAPARGDALGLRRFNDFFYDAWRTLRPPFPDGYPTVRRTEGTIDGHAGLTPYRWYTRDGEARGSAVLYIHGGAQVMGTPDQYEGAIADYVLATGVPFLLVDYRLAPEAQGLSQPDECLQAYIWLVEYATDLGVDPTRIAVMGDSAGGGIAAGVVERARRTSSPPAAAILIYPMLDDRTVTAPDAIAGLVNFRAVDNATGWGARLGARHGTEDVDPIEAPARIADLWGWPRTYLEVGELDLFRDEDITFMTRLVAASVPTQFHLWPGADHGFDLFAPDIALTQRALANRHAVISSL